MNDVGNIEFKIEQGKFPWELKPGEAIEVMQDGKPGLILCCPNCGKPASGNHEWNPDTKNTVTVHCSWSVRLAWLFKKRKIFKCMTYQPLFHMASNREQPCCFYSGAFFQDKRSGRRIFPAHPVFSYLLTLSFILVSLI